MIVKKWEFGEVSNEVTELIPTYELSKNAQATRIRFQEIQQQLDGGRFPGAIGAKKSKDLTGCNCKREVEYCGISLSACAERFTKRADDNCLQCHDLV